MGNIIPAMSNPEDKVAVITWAGLTTTNPAGLGVNIGRYSDRTVQVYGTYSGGASIQMQGSPDGGNTWGRCHDAWATLISLIDNTPFVIGDNPVLLRPLLIAGDGSTNLTVVVTAVMRA